MNLEPQFSALELTIINDQAALYSCACPLQISLQITSLRKLFDYQKQCVEMNNYSENEMQGKVHQRIAEATIKAHQIMEQCLDDILELEGWDKTKMKMPANIRNRAEPN